MSTSEQYQSLCSLNRIQKWHMICLGLIQLSSDWSTTTGWSKVVGFISPPPPSHVPSLYHFWGLVTVTKNIEKLQYRKNMREVPKAVCISWVVMCTWISRSLKFHAKVQLTHWNRKYIPICKIMYSNQVKFLSRQITEAGVFFTVNMVTCENNGVHYYCVQCHSLQEYNLSCLFSCEPVFEVRSFLRFNVYDSKIIKLLVFCAATTWYLIVGVYLSDIYFVAFFLSVCARQKGSTVCCGVCVCMYMSLCLCVCVTCWLVL